MECAAAKEVIEGFKQIIVVNLIGNESELGIDIPQLPPCREGSCGCEGGVGG